MSNEYLRMLEERFGHIMNKDEVNRQKSELEKTISDTYKKEGYDDISIDKDIAERAAYNIAYNNVITKEIESKYDKLSAKKDIDVNKVSEVAGYIREVLENSDNKIYKELSKVKDDDELLDYFANIVATNDRDREEINEHVKYIKNGKGDPKFLNLVIEAAKKGEIDHAQKTTYNLTTGGIGDTEREKQYSAAIASLENARAGYSISANPYARTGLNLERQVNSLQDFYQNMYQRAPLMDRA